MSVYTLSVNYISEKLVPPSLRGVKMLAWLRVILKPLQSQWNNVFDDYATGSGYAQYDVSLSYVRTDRVIFSNKSVYECILDATAGIPPDDSVYWVKINDIFIGANERLKYNSQKIVFEYALNKYFQIPVSPFIYITNNFVVADNVFVMSNSGLTSSVMPLNSAYQINFLGLVPAYATSVNDYTIYVPLAVYNALGTNAINRENAIRQFADKYNLAGIQYNVIAY